MKLKKLREERADLLRELDKLNNDKSETRNFKKIDELLDKIDYIDYQIEKDPATRMLKEQEKSEGDKMEIRTLKDVVLHNEKLEKRTYADHMDLDLGNLVKAMAGKENKSKEATYYRAMQSSGNKVVIPQQLSDKIIDFARNISAVFGKIPTIQMPSNNLKVAKQVSDVQANFVKEGELIPASEATFEAIDLEGKTLALWVPISEQLLDSAANLSQQLVQSCAKAIAVALDKALLYGDGIPGDPDHGHKIKGLMTYAGINKANHQVVNDTIDYDPILKAFGPIKKANLMPTDVALSTNVGLALAGYKTADGMYIDGPKVLNQYEITESNNMNDEHILAYDRNQLLLGIHKDITIEFGYSADMFQRIQKGLRIYLRTDLGLINEKAVSQITLQR